MKIVRQSYTIVNQTKFDVVSILKQIEKCARVTYKSEDKITEDSYEKFVDNLIKKDHSRALEFGTVHLKILSGKTFEVIKADLADKGLYVPLWLQYTVTPTYTFITTNYRHYINILKKLPYISQYFTSEDNEFYPKRYTVKFYTARGIADEFRTHIGLSHLMESTRWCLYSKDKFNNELTYIIPNWSKLKENTLEYRPFEIENKDVNLLNSLKQAELAYFDLIKLGCTAQEAREVLPLNIKAELISCGFEDAWKNFFYRRCAKDAHPMAQEIAIKLQKELF